MTNAGSLKQIAIVAYLPLALLAILSQHASVAIVYANLGVALPVGVEFWLLPLRTLAKLPGLSAAAAASGLGFSLLSAGLVATLSLWRVRHAGHGHLGALLTLIPVVQIGVILILSVLPADKPRVAGSAPTGAAHLPDVLLGVVGGMGLCVFAVVVSALVFGAYGWGLFVLAPLMMGWVTAYSANRKVLLSSSATDKLVILTSCIGGLLLLLFALEGLICLLMASPLAILCAWIGGVTGREMAIQRGDKAKPMMMSVAVLPLMIALEATMPVNLDMASQESIVVDAAPLTVWRAVTSEDAIEDRPALPFRLGLAYPLSAELSGSHVGARRTGHFSTGMAHERITVWNPGRQLAFEVLSTPPVMHELSPWKVVHAPHAVGYFQTAWTSFDLAPLSGGRTRLTVRSTSTLALDPAPYWAPMARWAISSNNRRVLAHLKAKAEAHPRPQPCVSCQRLSDSAGPA
jgi:hypothetical protein